MAWNGSGVMCTSFVDKFDDSLLATDWTSETELRAAFFGSGVTPNYTTDTAYGANTWTTGGGGNESSGAGYTPGGPLLVGTTFLAAAGVATFDCNNISIPNSTFDAEGYLGYDDTHADRALWAADFGSLEGTQDGTFLVTMDPAGVLYYDLVP